MTYIIFFYGISTIISAAAEIAKIKVDKKRKIRIIRAPRTKNMNSLSNKTLVYEFKPADRQKRQGQFAAFRIRRVSLL